MPFNPALASSPTPGLFFTAFNSAGTSVASQGATERLPGHGAPIDDAAATYCQAETTDHFAEKTYYFFIDQHKQWKFWVMPEYSLKSALNIKAQGSLQEIVEALHPLTVDRCQQTLLHIAAACKNAEVFAQVVAFLDDDIDVVLNATDNFQRTPLDILEQAEQVSSFAYLRSIKAKLGVEVT